MDVDSTDDEGEDDIRGRTPKTEAVTASGRPRHCGKRS
jgi:hypothetical protein